MVTIVQIYVMPLDWLKLNRPNSWVIVDWPPVLSGIMS